MPSCIQRNNIIMFFVRTFWKALLSELKISANTSTGIGYMTEYWSPDCEGITDFMQRYNAKSVCHSLSPREKTLLQFSGFKIFPNKVLIASFTLDLFLLVFVSSWLHNATAFSKFDSSQYIWLRICLTFLLSVILFLSTADSMYASGLRLITMLEDLLILFINLWLTSGKTETLGRAVIKLQDGLDLLCLGDSLIK